MTRDEAIAKYAAEAAADKREYLARAKDRITTINSCVCGATQRGGGLCAECWIRIAEKFKGDHP